MLTHRNLVANVQQSGAVAGITADDTAIAFLPFFHIYGMTVLMNLFLERRAKLVTMPRFDLELFLRLIQEHRATRLYIVPPVALALAKHPMVAEYDMSSVVEVFSGAAPLGPETEIAVGERLGAHVGPGLRHDRDEPDQPHDRSAATCATDRAGRRCPRRNAGS
jgi:acyl-CoA synthetase (AMP-forming)/AMP-acid ligase II